MTRKRYRGDWDEEGVPEREADDKPEPPRRSQPMTRWQKLQELADRGVDTWEEYRGEK